jgi:hypothetical protein
MTWIDEGQKDIPVRNSEHLSKPRRGTRHDVWGHRSEQSRVMILSGRDYEGARRKGIVKDTTCQTYLGLCHPKQQPLATCGYRAPEMWPEWLEDLNFWFYVKTEAV